MLLRTIIATAAMQLLPFGAAQNLTLAYSAATLLSGGIDDCPTPLAAEDCRRGIASAMVVVRELRAAGRDVLFVPLADRQTAFVQMHPLTWGVNAVVFDYFNLPVYFTRHSMFTSRRDLSKLQARDTRTKPLVSNVLVSPADDWYGVPERAHVHNGIGIIWIGSASEPNSAPPVASAAAGLRDLHTRGVRATVIVYEDMIPVDDFVVALHGLLIVHPSIVVDTWTLSALRKVGNTFVIGAPGESSSYLTWLDVGFAMDGAVADVAFREVSLTLDDARKDAQYVADQEFLKVHANLAGSNDPVVGESPHVMPVGRIDGNNYCMAGECPQGNLFADGIAYEYGTDFAFVSSGGLRGLGWSPGNISISNLWETLPFANTVCTGALLGISIFELVNYTTSVAKYTSERAVVGADRLLHHSGLRVAVNPNLAPSRLLSLEVLNRATGVYEPLERLRLYTWASDSFVCRTFDEYPKLLAGTLRGETAPVDHSALVQNVVADYITAVSPVAYAVDGRMLVTTEGEHHLALRDTQQTCSGDTYWDAGVATCLACADGFEQNFPGDVSCQKTEPDYVGLALSIALPFLAVVLCLAGVWVVRSEMTKRKGVRNVANAPKGGQVTLIFTDVQDSTKLWGCCPAAMSYSLDLHHRIIRECIAEYRGYEVKTVGDCFMIAISDAGKGVALARDIQLRFQATQFPSAIAAVYGAKTDADLDAVADDPDDLLDLHPVWNGLRVRIGMHSGKPDVTFDEVTKGYDYYGPPVNVAARVEGVAKGGQIVATKDVTDEDWDPEELGIQVTALGSVELKGVANPVDVLEFSPNSIRGRVHSPLTAADNADVGPECDGKSFDGSDAGTFSSSHALNEPFKKFLSFAVRIAPPKDQERALDELCKLWRVGKHRDQEERIDALVRRVAPSMRKDIELSNPSLAVSVRRESGALARRESLRRHDVPRRRSSVKPPTPFLK